jgi:hypothetical protein
MSETTNIVCEQSLSVISFITPIATIIAAIIGGFLLWNVHKANMVRSAKANFITAVYTELEGIYPEGVQRNQNIFQKLHGAQPALLRAASIFRFYLSTKELDEFDNSWDSYIKMYQETTEQAQTVHAFYGEGDSPYKKLCICIDRMLEHAKT